MSNCPFCKSPEDEVTGLYTCGTLPGSDTPSIHCSVYASPRGAKVSEAASELVAAMLRIDEQAQTSTSYRQFAQNAVARYRSKLAQLKAYEERSAVVDALKMPSNGSVFTSVDFETVYPSGPASVARTRDQDRMMRAAMFGSAYGANLGRSVEEEAHAEMRRRATAAEVAQRYAGPVGPIAEDDAFFYQPPPR
jgi:hypothetical protein